MALKKKRKKMSKLDRLTEEIVERLCIQINNDSSDSKEDKNIFCLRICYCACIMFFKYSFL